MHIRYGYTLDVVCEAPAELVTGLDVHSSRRADITEPDDMHATALANGAALDCGEIGVDRFGNLFRRLAVPAGGARLTAQGIIHDSGFADPPATDARAMAAGDLPEEVRLYLDESLLCPQAGFVSLANVLGASAPAGWSTVQAIVDHVRQRLRLDPAAGVTGRTAADAIGAGGGSLDDLVHVAIALCRVAGIPARYATGYLAETGGEAPAGGGFAVWFEAYLDGRWWMFDVVADQPRIGRILIAEGRDAGDAAVVGSSAPFRIARQEVVAEEVTGDRFPVTSRERRERWVARR
ncbi:MAG: transglutaminase family protein [Piscinibacter sp.]